MSLGVLFLTKSIPL